MPGAVAEITGLQRSDPVRSSDWLSWRAHVRAVKQVGDFFVHQSL
jgi:hypothetical protein